MSAYCSVRHVNNFKHEQRTEEIKESLLRSTRRKRGAPEEGFWRVSLKEGRRGTADLAGKYVTKIKEGRRV